LRILIVTAVLLIALVAGGLVTVSRLVVWDDYRDELTARAEAMTGQNVAIQGSIDLNLLPLPTLTLGQTIVASPADAMRLEIERLDLELKPLPLLGGRLDVDEVRLVRPVLQVAPAPDGHVGLMELAGAAWLPLAPDGPRRLSVIEGQAILPELAGARSGRLEQVNLDLSTAGPSAAVVLGGTFALNGQPLRIDARLGRPNEDSSSTLRLELASHGLGAAGPSTLTFGGVVRWRSDAPRLRGELILAGADARSTIGTVADAIGRQVMPMGPWLATPFRLSGRVGLEDDRLELSDLALGLDGTELTGQLRLLLAAAPEIGLRLETARLGIPDVTAGDLEDGLAPFLMLASTIRGEVDLAVGALEYRGAEVRRLRASLRLSGDGAVTISDVRAVLPGETDVSFAGGLAGAGAETELRGTLTAVTRNPRGTLGWLGLSPDGVPEGRLDSISLASAVSLRRDAVRFRDIELRVDTTRVTGSLALDAAPRPQIAANLVLDRLDLDAYWPDRPPADVLGGLAAPLGAVDAAIEARVERLTWRGVHLLDVAFAGRSVNEHLRLEELTVGDFADAEARVTGAVNLADGVFDLSAELRGVHAPRVLRRLGIEPSPLLLRLRPLEVEGAARGSLEAAEVELEIEHGGAKAELAGEVGWTDRQARYALDLRAEHPDYRGLLQELGAVVHAAGGPAAPLVLAGKVQGETDGSSSVAGTARLGDTSFTGRVAWEGEDRSTIDARISVGEPTAPVLGGLLEVIGWRPEWPGTDGAFRGRWSERPLALGMLDGFDGQLVLSGKGGLAGDGVEVNARLENGELTVDHLSLGLWDGRLQGQLSLDVGRPLPYLVAAFDLADFDPSRLAAWLGVPPLLTGPSSLHIETTGAGDNVRALVGSLIGGVEVVAQDGFLAQALPDDFAASSGAPPEDPGPDGSAGVAASFALERGVLVAQPVEFDLGGTAAHLEGVIDLFLWVVDLTLRADDGAMLKVVGPLHRPQIRLAAATGPEQASPAPSPTP
jgi:AsmA family/AsmA-like C-terminal region